jgi:hypothetical protein
MVAAADRAYPPWAQRQQRFERFVTSEDELRAAIRSLASPNTSGTARLSGGGRIVICAPFSVSAPIVIPFQAPAITICSAAPVPIRSVGVLATLFDVRAFLFTVEDLLVLADSAGNGFTAFVTLSGDSTAGASSAGCVIRGNKVQVDRILVDASTGDSDDGQLLDNWQLDELNGAHAASVYIDSNRWLVRGNTIKDGGGDSITVDVNGAACRLLGNDLGFGDITTTLSGGGGIIDGNCRKGVITAPGDTIGDNS